MTRVKSGVLPAASLLNAYRDAGHYTDCFTTTVNQTIRADDYFVAFYTTWLFKLERRILAAAVDKPSTDAQALDLALGRTDTFSAWRVEARTPDQLLLSDFRGNTRSWLMIGSGDTPACTRLYFGSAVLTRLESGNKPARIPASFRALLGFHKVYSRTLLYAAANRVKRSDQSVAE